PPGTADLLRLLEDRERVDPGSLHLDAGRDATEPATHHHDTRCPRGPEQLGVALHSSTPSRTSRLIAADRDPSVGAKSENTMPPRDARPARPRRRVAPPPDHRHVRDRRPIGPVLDREDLGYG